MPWCMFIACSSLGLRGGIEQDAHRKARPVVDMSKAEVGRQVLVGLLLPLLVSSSHHKRHARHSHHHVSHTQADHEDHHQWPGKCWARVWPLY